MDWITISGLKPWDGRYELDINNQPLTTREWGWAKRYAGYLPVNLDETTFTDPEMIAVLAIVALWRNGKIETTEVAALWERLQDAPFGATVGWEAGPAEDEGDAGPPPSGTAVSSSINGDDSSSTSETLVLPPKHIGSPLSATSRSAPATSVS